MTVNNFHNPNRDIITIFTAAGEPHECTRLNALELVSGQGFRWKKEEGEQAGEEQAAPTPEPAPEPVPEVAPEAAPEDPTVPEPAVDHVNDPLSAIAEAVAGSDDVAKYLEGFTADALRTMADERYGVRLHHKLGKDKVTEKIIELESEKLAGELDQ